MNHELGDMVSGLLYRGNNIANIMLILKQDFFYVKDKQNVTFSQ
jgi:hypothetical protein